MSAAMFCNHEADIRATTRSSTHEILDQGRFVRSFGQMTSDSNPVNLPALRSDSPKEETCEPGDRVNVISLTLAAIGGIALLAITIGSIWK
jgi:hypothetical protein